MDKNPGLTLDDHDLAEVRGGWFPECFPPPCFQECPETTTTIVIIRREEEFEGSSFGGGGSFGDEGGFQ